MNQFIESDFLDLLNVQLQPPEFHARYLSSSRSKLLCLRGSNVDDQGLKGVENLRKTLYCLDLDNTQITDESIPVLSRLKALTELYVSNTRLTSSGIKTLHRKLPSCAIVWQDRQNGLKSGGAD